MYIPATVKPLCLNKSTMHLLLTNLHSKSLINIIYSSSLNPINPISSWISWFDIRQKPIKCPNLHQRHLSTQRLQILLRFYNISGLLFLLRIRKLGWDTVLASWDHHWIWFVQVKFSLWPLRSGFVVYHSAGLRGFYFWISQRVVEHVRSLL